MDKRDLQLRTKRFALRVMQLVDALPNTISGRAVAGQLVRAGTSVAANYRAACRGRSRAEFIAKIGIVEEEADESSLWMELAMEGGLLKERNVRPLHEEAVELVAIMAASRITAGRNRASIGNRQSAIGNSP